jgi:hypothetical protein
MSAGGPAHGVPATGWWRTVRAVAWSFFGVRKRADHEADLATLKPVQVLVVGGLSGVLFVLGLMALVRMIVGSGVAG